MSGSRHISRSACPHAAGVAEGRSEEKACRVCGLETDLRVCLICGAVGCCESRAAHDTQHFRETGHALIRPHRCGYDFVWCYACEAYLD